MLFDISERHKDVLPLMFCGQAVYLQNMDSEIASGVLRHFVAKGVPVLVVHDSFIVARDYAGELEAVMGDVYQKHMGFGCPVERNSEVVVWQ